jgi:hypothetical protein
VSIQPNGIQAEVSSNIVTDFSRADALSRRGQFQAAASLLDKWLSGDDLTVNLRASAQLIQFYGAFDRRRPERAKGIALQLAELDSKDALWEIVEAGDSTLQRRPWYYHRGAGTCHVVDILHLESELAPKPDHRHPDHELQIDAQNARISGITRQLEACVQFTHANIRYKKWLFWNYYKHDVDLVTGTPRCSLKLTALVDDLADTLGIEDAQLVADGAVVYQYCARTDDAIALLRKSLSFMHVVHSDEKKRQLYRRPVLQAIVHLAEALLQRGDVKECIAICEEYQVKISTCTDVLVHAYSFSNQYERAVLLMHSRELYKHAQNDSKRENGQLLAEVANQWKWNVGVRSRETFERHQRDKQQLTDEPQRAPSNESAASLTHDLATPDASGWSSLRNDQLHTTRCNIEKRHVDTLDVRTWRRDYLA